MCAECLEEKHAGVIYGLHLGDYDFRYIGKSNNQKRRYREHINDALRGGGYAVHNWIRKHGAENVSMTIIETFTEEDIDQLEEREILHIAQARAYYGENLNLDDGGKGNGRVWTEEDRIRASQKATGKLHSESTRAKLSAINSGSNHPQYGTKRSPEVLAKISASKMGHEVSAETRAKLSAAHKGRPQSEEAKLNKRIAAHRRHHTNRNIVKSDCIYCMEGGN